MEAKNKYLLPKYNKHTHKEILDLSTPVPKIQMARVNPYILTTALFLFLLGFVLFWIPFVNPLTMGILAKSIVWRFG